DHGDPPRPAAGELMKAAEREEHVFERIERELFGGGALARGRRSPPAVLLGQQPITLRFAARAGGGERLAAGKDQQRSRIGGGEFHGVPDVLHIQPWLAALKIAEVPGIVGHWIVAEIPHGVPGTEDEMLVRDGSQYSAARAIEAWRKGRRKTRNLQNSAKP